MDERTFCLWFGFFIGVGVTANAMSIYINYKANKDIEGNKKK
jgi:hypothetical protein